MGPKQSGFTLLELLLVITIIGILSAILAFPIYGYLQQGRDVKRKTSLEQIRSSLELYKSNNTNSSYPVTGNLTVLVTQNYINPLPTDGRSTHLFAYTALPAGCTEATPCTDYVLGAKLEKTPTTTQCSVTGLYCNNGGTNVSCDYCIGPYGQK